MQLANPRQRDDFIVTAMVFHFISFRVINTSLNVVAKVTNKKHFMLRIPQKWMLLSIFDSMNLLLILIHRS